MRPRESRYFDPEEPVFFIGLDLGQARDYTAVAIVERLGEPSIYRVKELKRFPLNTPYPDIVSKMQMVIQDPRIDPNLLVIDATGVGRPIVDLFWQRKIHLIPIIIHGGDKISKGGYTKVPKRDIVTTLQVLFQQKRLKIAAGLPEAQILIEELLSFQVRINENGHDTYGTWREGAHDDLVFAVAMAVFAAEKRSLPQGMRYLSKRRHERGLPTIETRHTTLLGDHANRRVLLGSILGRYSPKN